MGLMLAAALLALNLQPAASEPTKGIVGAVSITRVPDGGIQPQTVSAPGGTVHLVYYKGDAREGDLFYARRAPGEVAFGAPVRVNSEPGSACAVGTIRGAQLAVGAAGRVHVVWNGSNKTATAPAPGHGKHPECPMLYTRLDPATGRFEPQRNLMTCTRALDGGGTIAADDAGGVVVAWHAAGAAVQADGERNRQVWVARSGDDGATFARETAVDDGRGACACCGMVAMADRRGGVHLFYRVAEDDVGRGMALLSAGRGVAAFAASRIDEWRVQTCPMSSCSLAEVGERIVLAWENRGQVHVATIEPASGTPVDARTPPSDSRTRKHPRVATNARGEMLLVWTENTGWQKGGSLAWQVFDALGQPVEGAAGRADGVPVWSFGAPVARADGTFEVVY